jgi:hypothetical protein
LFFEAIVAPFWHGEVIAASETISPAICGCAVLLSIAASAILYFVGPFWCHSNLFCFHFKGYLHDKLKILSHGVT